MSEQRRVIGGDVSASAGPAKVQANKPAPLVEDTSVAGGTDKATGAPVIRPKGPDGKGDKLNETTDPRERP
jgi:hypothetical protein